jgi:hypothetical protein
VYSPPSADGGNPWGAGGPPKTVAAAVTPEPKPASTRAPESRAPETRRPDPRPEPKPEPKKPEPKPVPGANINLNLIPDPAARAAIVRTRDACLAEASRRKIAFDDFDAFHRVDASQWEATLVVKTGKGASRSCRVVIETGKATIK